MERRLLLGTVGVGLMVVGAGVLGIKSLHLPQTAVAVLLTVLFLVGGWLTVAALFGLLPARPEIDPDHKIALRQLADRIGGTADPYRSTLERSVFAAHYPKLAAQRTAVERGTTEQESRRIALSSEIVETMRGRFSQQDFWRPDAIAAAAASALRDQADKVTIIAGAIWFVRPLIEGVTVPPQLVWGNSPIWWPLRDSPAASATDGDLAAKVGEVQAWFTEVGQSEPARAYRDAILNLRERQRELHRRLEPIRNHERIGWNRRCLICRPRKWWEFWR
jgi:hypothetical protein